MRGATPPLPNMPSWCGAQLKTKHKDNFTFTFGGRNNGELATTTIANYL